MAQKSIGMYELEYLFPSQLRLKPSQDQICTTSTTGISVFEPGAGDVRILLVDLKLEIGYPLWKSDCSYDSRNTCSNTDDSQRPLAINWAFLYDCMISSDHDDLMNQDVNNKSEKGRRDNGEKQVRLWRN